MMDGYNDVPAGYLGLLLRRMEVQLVDYGVTTLMFHSKEDHSEPLLSTGLRLAPSEFKGSGGGIKLMLRALVHSNVRGIREFSKHWFKGSCKS